MPEPHSPSFAVVAIVRNELPYLIEWLAHHRVVGFGRFYLADHESDDGTSELLTELDRLGYLKRVPFRTPKGRSPQFSAYESLLRDHARAEEWVAVIDADEFIVPLGEHRDVRTALAPLVRRPEVGAVALNWACYGSSGRESWTPGLVLEQFTRRAARTFGPNHHYKTVLRRAAFRGTHENPHHFELEPGSRYVRMDGADVLPGKRLGLSADVLWEGLRVQHYLVKSRQEFEEGKGPKGRVAVAGGRKGEEYFARHDRNDASDPAPAWLLNAVKIEVSRLEGALVSRGLEAPGTAARPAYGRWAARAKGSHELTGTMTARIGIRVRTSPREGVLGSVDRPKPGQMLEADGYRITGWVYVDPELDSLLFDGNVYFEGASGTVVSAPRNRPRADVDRHLAERDKAAGAYGFVFEAPLEEEGEVYINGSAGREVLARISFTRPLSIEGESTIVLIGHSASGKSAILELLGVDRSDADMDRWFAKELGPVPVERVLAWIQEPREVRLLALSNDEGILRSLAALRRRGEESLSDVRFVFLNRSLSVVAENLRRQNTDGCYHPSSSDQAVRALYFRFLGIYADLADDEICYQGSELSELAQRVVAYCNAARADLEHRSP